MAAILCNPHGEISEASAQVILFVESVKATSPGDGWPLFFAKVSFCVGLSGASRHDI